MRSHNLEKKSSKRKRGFRKDREVTKGDRKALKKEEVLLTEDSKEAALEGKVTLPVGSSWFIIENRTDKKVEMHLQCLAP